MRIPQKNKMSHHPLAGPQWEVRVELRANACSCMLSGSLYWEVFIASGEKTNNAFQIPSKGSQRAKVVWIRGREERRRGKVFY